MEVEQSGATNTRERQWREPRCDGCDGQKRGGGETKGCSEKEREQWGYCSNRNNMRLGKRSSSVVLMVKESGAGVLQNGSLKILDHS